MWDGSSNVRYLHQRFRPCAEQSRAKNLQIFQHLCVPEAFDIIDVGNGIGLSDVQNSGISSGRDPQILLKTCDSTHGTGLILQVTGRSPGIEVGFQNLGSEVVVTIIGVWVVSVRLRMNSTARYRIRRCKFESPGSMPPSPQWEGAWGNFRQWFSKRTPQDRFRC